MNQQIRESHPKAIHKSSFYVLSRMSVEHRTAACQHNRPRPRLSKCYEAAFPQSKHNTIFGRNCQEKAYHK